MLRDGVEVLGEGLVVGMVGVELVELVMVVVVTAVVDAVMEVLVARRCLLTLLVLVHGL